jgi:hypothetical protein
VSKFYAYLYSKDNGVPWTGSCGERVFSMEESTVVLPARVMNWAGLAGGEVYAASKLMQLNDHEGEWHTSPIDDQHNMIVYEAKSWLEKYGGNSFKEIAKAIRDNL